MSAAQVDTLTALVRGLPRPDGATHYAVVGSGFLAGGVEDRLAVYWLRQQGGRWEVNRRWETMTGEHAGRDWQSLESAVFQPELIVQAARALS